MYYLGIEQDRLMDDDDIGDANVSQGVDDKLWNGYKLVGDNLDKNVKPRYRRIDHQTLSLHFFHCYAVKDRIDLSHVSDDPNPFLFKPISELEVEQLLPSASDSQAIMQNFGILVSRVLVEELPYFNTTFEDVVEKHIKHLYYEEMSKKSETVSMLQKNINTIICTF